MSDLQALAAVEQEKMYEGKERDAEKLGEVNESVREAGASSGFNPAERTVHRALKPRHLAMIALGGTIGTGLFVGSGQALATGGPLGCLLGYIIMGTIVYSMMLALGEMATLFPDSGGFTGFATRFLDPSLGFAVGWNYWYSYGITIPTELVACALVVEYWNGAKGISTAAFIAPLFVAVLTVNFLGTRVFGEVEFWTAGIKILAIVALIILGIAINCGAGPGTTGYTGFSYWRDPGAIAQYVGNDGIEIPGTWGRFVAFWAVLVQAAFSFLGTEIVAVTVGEAANPRKTVPKAIRRVFWRIFFFYFLSILIIGINVKYTNPELLSPHSDTVSASPFVIAIDQAQIKALPSIINAVLLVAAWSAGNSDLYAASRTLYALAIEGKAPRIFKRCTKAGLPIYCVLVTSLFGPLAFITVSSTGEEVFNWLYNLSTITGLITWEVILVSYLRFYYGMRRQNISRDELPYKAPLQPYLSWFGAIGMGLVILLNGFGAFVGGFSINSFLAAYISLPAFAILWVGYKLWGGAQQGLSQRGWFNMTTWVSLDAMDFETGRRELDEEQARDEAREAAKPSTRMSRVLDFIF